MDKLSDFVPKFRVCEETKKGLVSLAIKHKRRLNDYLRLVLDELVEKEKPT